MTCSIKQQCQRTLECEKEDAEKERISERTKNYEQNVIERIHSTAVPYTFLNHLMI